MKLIIDIPEEVKQTFDNAKNEDLYGNYYDYNSLIGKAIQNGTPLPKGHGRLIDVNDLLDDINLEDSDYNRDVNTGEIITLENIDRIPTIIEADKESEDKEYKQRNYWNRCKQFEWAERSE